MSVTVRYGEQQFLFDLPKTPRQDPYGFLQEQIGYETSSDLTDCDIQVIEVGSNLQWPSDRPLKIGTYRVVRKRPAVLQQSSCRKRWTPVIKVSRVEYPPNWAGPTPPTLHLTLYKYDPNQADCERLTRLREYAADCKPLELSHFRHFGKQIFSYTFVVNPTLDESDQQLQHQYFSHLQRCGLVLRISSFAVGKELLLRSGGEGKLYAYIVHSGYIAEQARVEFDWHMRHKELVLVLDLDQTLIEASKVGPHSQHMLRSGQAMAIHFDGEVDKLMVVPRANLVQFFRHLKGKYKIFFCTTGIQSYAEAVLKAICSHLLNDNSVTLKEAEWINCCFDKSRVLSVRVIGSRNYKSLGMLLHVGSDPEIAARLVMILDDSVDVWRHCDRALVHQPSQQDGIRSYGSAGSTTLQRYGLFFQHVHDFVFQGKPALIPLTKVPEAMMQQYLQTGTRWCLSA